VVLSVDHYEGREQTYVKHFFLESYLERLVHKTASKYINIAYVDGFSGPWQSENESYKDTSFWLALTALRRAKASWKKQGREVTMSAHLVEKNAAAFERLSKVREKFPDINITTYLGDFVSQIDSIRSSISDGSFSFFFIDPTGWKIPTQKLTPLISRPHSEVVFNFMFDFINRAASMSDPALMRTLDELILVGGWREKLENISPQLSSNDAAKLREAILIDAFRETLKKHGNYEFVADIPILRPLKDRTLYFLVYGTRSKTGIEVFRDCHVKTLSAQSDARLAAKTAKIERDTGQGSLFANEPLDSQNSDNADFLVAEEKKAGELFLEIVGDAKEPIKYGSIWPQILEQQTIRKTTLGQIVNEYRKNGFVKFLDWPDRKRKPEDHFFVKLGTTKPN